MAIEIVDFPINSMVIFHSYGKRLPEGRSSISWEKYGALTMFFFGEGQFTSLANYRFF